MNTIKVFTGGKKTRVPNDITVLTICFVDEQGRETEERKKKVGRERLGENPGIESVVTP